MSCQPFALGCWSSGRRVEPHTSVSIADSDHAVIAREAWLRGVSKKWLLRR